MTVRAVLFDFSGTMFRLEHEPSWLEGFTDHTGELLDDERRTELLRRLTQPDDPDLLLSAEHRDAWERRDLDPVLHRAVSLELLRLSGVSDVAQAESLYGRLVDPHCWTPYPDTARALARLHAAGVPVAVVSNIPFDIRPAFARHGMAEHLDAVLMSYVEGLIKPDPKLFQRACDTLGVAGEHTLMIGDSEEADGGAAAIGARVAIVDPLPTTERPDGLLAALDAHGL